MTLQEAIFDKERPLSMTPQEWMQYIQADEKQDESLIENQVKRIVAEQGEENFPQADEKLDIGIEQMVLGCRVAMKSLQELSRLNVSPNERKAYDEINDLINNAISPYLADILEARKGLYK